MTQAVVGLRDKGGGAWVLHLMALWDGIISIYT